jgi:hypothetical protein
MRDKIMDRWLDRQRQNPTIAKYNLARAYMGIRELRQEAIRQGISLTPTPANDWERTPEEIGDDLYRGLMEDGVSDVS